MLTGFSGTGKTVFLRHLNDLNEQTLDLERLATHRGSAFGTIGRQPANAAFAAAVSQAWHATASDRLLWVEEKAAYLGSVAIPIPLQRAIATAPNLELIATIDARVRRTCTEYADATPEELLAGLERVAHRLGPQRTQAVRRSLLISNRAAAAELLLTYYDMAYARRAGLLQRDLIGQTSLEDDPLECVHAAERWFEEQQQSPGPVVSEALVRTAVRKSATGAAG
ncbi:MAG: hypothetical protein IOD05_00720 [Rhodobacter sp.]|nr:hypothetical protein [Rhodobacter sp.]